MYLGIFRLEFDKKIYFHFRNQYPWMFQYAMFHAKTKIFKFSARIALFEYFWAGIWKNHSHTWNQHPRIFLKVKFRTKMKMLEFRAKITYLAILGIGNLKYYCHIWNQHPWICQKCVFNSYCEFWYTVHFFAFFFVRVIWEAE